MSVHLNFARAAWTKSSYSSVEGGNCVEWAPALAAAHGIVPVRDSKISGGPALAFGPGAWSSFVAAVRGGGFQP
ncbi:DUF397 domain-containing protein [Streptomyces hiroshimensis]|uniref:DUF397 domain-containing protein n=1 Tax=Streptomyces hiroshimensis TaxID=66424 RepID=A0ABQ2YFB9_9ACTN|nr:DUF397 domain-containing protein [Streptomyces hiroshimensis]GGX81832.1 hypothetical protein GCM10010324_29260 [Streptomyces hiroshimensis]